MSYETKYRGYVKFVRGTRTAWNSIAVKDPDTLYFIVEDNAISDLTFTITKAEIEEGKEADFFIMPTVVAIKGDTHTSFQISDFELNTEKQVANEYNECKFEIVSYDIETNKLGVKLVSNNYNMEHAISVEPDYKTLKTLDVFSKVEFSTDENAEQAVRTDVTDTFFDDFKVDAGYYWVYFGDSEKYWYVHSQRDYSTIDRNLFDGGLVLHFEEGKKWVIEPTYEFEVNSWSSDTYDVSLNKLTYYCGDDNPVTKVTNEGINDVYALTRETYCKSGKNEMNAYLLYSIGSGAAYGTDYAFDNFFISSSHLSVNTGTGYFEHPYSGHIIDIYLHSPWTYSGTGMKNSDAKLLTTNNGILGYDEEFSITNYSQQTFYVGLIHPTTGVTSYKSVVVKFSEKSLLKTNDAHVDIVSKYDLGGHFAYVNANAGRDIKVNSNPLKIWNGEAYVDGYIYISEKGYLTISETELTEAIDQAGTIDSGKYVYFVRIGIPYEYCGIDQTIYTDLTIYRDSFYTTNNSTFNHVDDIQILTQGVVYYTIEGKENYVDPRENHITCFYAYRFNPEELISIDDLKDINLDDAITITMKETTASDNYLARKYEYVDSELITQNVNGEDRYFVKLNYTSVIGDVHYNDCFKLIEVICA